MKKEKQLEQIRQDFLSLLEIDNLQVDLFKRLFKNMKF